MRAAEPDHPGLTASYRELLRGKVGVDIAVELVAPGATASLTEIERRQKPGRHRLPPEALTPARAPKGRELHGQVLDRGDIRDRRRNGRTSSCRCCWLTGTGA